MVFAAADIFETVSAEAWLTPSQEGAEPQLLKLVKKALTANSVCP
jgi:hypothetical protein